MRSERRCRVRRHDLGGQHPTRFQRRGGRKRIVAPDGSELAPATKPQPDGTILKALARAWWWRGLLDTGVYTSITDIAEAEKLNQSYVSRILRLTLLAPDVVERILDGRQGSKLDLARLSKPFPIEWERQREQLLAAA